VFTSYYHNPRASDLGLTPVAISAGVPRWFRGRRYPQLAPTRAMLKMTKVEYDRLFDAILARLDPKQVAQDLGEGAVLLCWEKPGQRCHRRRVAEWLEEALGIEVPELGFERAATLSYHAMPSTLKAEKHRAPFTQRLLFD
jgi:hypothetical protein